MRVVVSNCNLRRCDHLVTRSSATAEIAHDADDETAIEGHSRSSVVPIDAAYMTSY